MYFKAQKGHFKVLVLELYVTDLCSLNTSHQSIGTSHQSRKKIHSIDIILQSMDTSLDTYCHAITFDYRTAFTIEPVYKHLITVVY